MEVDAVIAEWLAYLQVEQGCAPLTLTSHRWELERLAGYLRETGLSTCVAGITTPLLRRYLVTLGTLQARTVARKVFTLRSFFRYCLEQGYTAGNPATGLKAPPPPKQIPTYLTREELRRLFAVAEARRGRAARTHEVMVKALAYTVPM